jgi:hypothetical protein
MAVCARHRIGSTCGRGWVYGRRPAGLFGNGLHDEAFKTTLGEPIYEFSRRRR